MKTIKIFAALMLTALVSCSAPPNELVATTIIAKEIGDGEDGWFKRYGVFALSNGETCHPKYGIYKALSVGDTIILEYRGKTRQLVAVSVPKLDDNTNIN